MDLRFSEEEERFRQEVREFIKQELPPDWKGTGLLSEAKGEEEWQFAREMMRKIGEKGWHSLAWPEELGGQDSPAKQFIFSEEMYYSRLPGVDLVGALMCAPAIIQHGTEEQKKKFLTRTARGEIVWCQGYSEPGAGSDLASLTTRAVEKDDCFILDGQKVWSTNADHADWCFLLARTDPNVVKHKGISFFLMDMKSPGVTALHLPNIVGTYCEIFLDNVRVPRENLVGGVNNGWKVANTVLGFERSGVHRIAATWRNLDRITDFARSSKRNGIPLFQDPVIRSRLAHLHVESQAVRHLAYRIVWLHTTARDRDISYEVSIGRLSGALFQQHVAAAALDILGPYGQLDPGSSYAPPDDFCRDYLWSLAATVGAGTAEIQRNIIATRGLGLPRG